MSALLQAVFVARERHETAQRSLAVAEAEYDELQTSAADAAEQAVALRDELVRQRAADLMAASNPDTNTLFGGGSAAPKLTSAVVTDAEIDSAARELATKQKAQTVESLRKQAFAAEAAVRTAIVAWADEKGAAEIADFCSILEKARAPLARAVAAAKISRDHSQVPGSHGLGQSQLHETVNRLIVALWDVDWPARPKEVRPTWVVPNKYGRALTDFPGAADEHEKLCDEIEGIAR